jgi:ribosomal protein S12 methylthiotransferase
VLGTGEVPEIVGAIGGPPSRQGRFGEPGSGSVAPLRFFAAHDAPGTQHLAPSTVAPSTLPTYIYDADTPRLLATPKHYAYVKIAEGCDYKCAFCIIPTLRGKYRSRTSDSIVTEARGLAARGVKELLLISQDTTFYGIDRPSAAHSPASLRELNTIDGLEWIRCSTSIRRP